MKRTSDFRTPIQTYCWLAILASCAGAANAGDLTSAYSSTDPDRCDVLRSAANGTVYKCPGPEGRSFLLKISEHKVFVSYGSDPMQEMVWTQALPGTHRIGDTLEWVMDGSTPVATILRYFIDRSAADLPDDQVLVVTRLGDGNTCHIAFVDARRNANANNLARQIVAEHASEWSCATMAARTYEATHVSGSGPDRN